MNFFQKYKNYINDNPQKLWFKRKLYGWGWTPVTKEGWIIVIVYILAVVAFALTIDNDSSTSEVFFTFILPFVFLTMTLIRICYRKGESPKWMWGIESDEDSKNTPE